MTRYFNKNGIIFVRFYTVSAFVFMLLFLYTFLPGGNEAIAQGNPGGVKADFLFEKPTKYFGFRFGIFSPEADSDLFDMVTEELTLKKGDFRAWDFGMELGFVLHDRIDLVFNFDHASESKRSEFRDYVDGQGLPITQSTRFSHMPLTAGIKYLLVPRGRQIGQYSWHPSSIVPYVSGGGGLLWYEFKQHGDFVDSETLEIFPAYLKSSGDTFTYYLGCGTDFNIAKSTSINLDFRYYWGDDDLDGDFVGFDPIELGGYRLTAGIQWHF
jgi:hypothetical protein